MDPVMIGTALGLTVVTLSSLKQLQRRRRQQQEREQLETVNAFRAHWNLPLLSSLPGTAGPSSRRATSSTAGGRSGYRASSGWSATARARGGPGTTASERPVAIGRGLSSRQTRGSRSAPTSSAPASVATLTTPIRSEQALRGGRTARTLLPSGPTAGLAIQERE